MASVKHSKYRNAGILFELLVRQVTADTLAGKPSSAALLMLRKFYSAKTELGKELVLYRTLSEATNLSEPRALSFLDLVISQRTKLNEKLLNNQKYELIKEIRAAYPLKEFLSSRLPQYRLYASVSKTFDSIGQMDVRAITEVSQARFTIVEHMMGKARVKTDAKQEALIETFKAQQDDLRLLSYKILVDKFNERYQGLDDRQKVLLREYIHNVSNTNSLRDHINTQVPVVKKEIERLAARVSNKVTAIKLAEVVNQLDGITKGQIVKDNQVAALLTAFQLVKELKVAVGGDAQ